MEPLRRQWKPKCSDRYKCKEQKYEREKCNEKGKILISHSWCDLFTKKDGISFCYDDKSKYVYIKSLQDGWIDGNICYGKIMQPDDNVYTRVESSKPGFAAKAITKTVFQLGDLYSNF